MTTLRRAWAEVYPTLPWPGEDSIAALGMIVEEIQILRTLDRIVQHEARARDAAMRAPDEVQRAHDLLVNTMMLGAGERETMLLASSLCWVLKHEHNTMLDAYLMRAEQRLRDMGYALERLPELQVPGVGEDGGGI